MRPFQCHAVLRAVPPVPHLRSQLHVRQHKRACRMPRTQTVIFFTHPISLLGVHHFISIGSTRATPLDRFRHSMSHQRSGSGSLETTLAKCQMFVAKGPVRSTWVPVISCECLRPLSHATKPTHHNSHPPRITTGITARPTVPSVPKRYAACVSAAFCCCTAVMPIEVVFSRLLRVICIVLNLRYCLRCGCCLCV